jgi:nucleotide-binding universal stress UspA family protein
MTHIRMMPISYFFEPYHCKMILQQVCLYKHAVMKKIIAAFDGLKYSAATARYAIQLASTDAAHITGVFLEDITYTSYKIYELLNKDGVSEKKLNQYKEKDRLTRLKATSSFENACQQAGVNYNSHHDKNIALKELLHESIYADLLVIDRKETLTHYDEKIPTRFIRELLADVQCPVLLVPQVYKPVEKIILLYDGEPSSIHAIKMFSYMLAGLQHLPAEIVTVKSQHKDLHVPDSKLMKEYIKRHFPKAAYTVLKGQPEQAITDYLKSQQQQAVVVAGAYRRGNVSRWFRASMADTIMKEVQLPLFIAHNK